MPSPLNVFTSACWSQLGRGWINRLIMWTENDNSTFFLFNSVTSICCLPVEPKYADNFPELATDWNKLMGAFLSFPPNVFLLKRIKHKKLVIHFDICLNLNYFHWNVRIKNLFYVNYLVFQLEKMNFEQHWWKMLL